jgi:hypothetical protein
MNPLHFLPKETLLKRLHAPNFHGRSPTTNRKIPRVLAAIHVTEPSTFKKSLGDLKKCCQEQKIIQVNVSTSGAVDLFQKLKLQQQKPFYQKN